MTTIVTRSRHPAAALALSALLPGLGQLYNGQLNKALLLLMVFALLTTGFAVPAVLVFPPDWTVPALATGLLSVLLLYLYGLIDAARTAYRTPALRLHGWQTAAVYPALATFAYLGVLHPGADYVRERLVEPFGIPSATMMPSVWPGDFVFADKRVNCPGCEHALRRGDVAVFVYPNDRTLYYIKRVIGLPGDRVRMEGRQVFVNDNALALASEEKLVTEAVGAQIYRTYWTLATEEALAWTVPPGEVFVLGDNRDATHDSREFGTVPLRDVVGRATRIWFSYDWKTGVRWNRLGLAL